MNQSTNSSKKANLKSNKFWKIFWLSFLVISLAYAWYSFYVPSNDISWNYNLDSAKERATDSGKNMMLFFTGEWCVPCRIMKREVFADTEVMKKVNSQIVPVMVNIDEPEWKDIVKQYKVGTTPITIFTDPQGNVLDYAVGKIDKTKFLEMFESIVKTSI